MDQTWRDDYHEANTNVFTHTCYDESDGEEWSKLNPALTGINLLPQRSAL